MGSKIKMDSVTLFHVSTNNGNIYKGASAGFIQDTIGEVRMTYYNKQGQTEFVFTLDWTHKGVDTVRREAKRYHKSGQLLEETVKEGELALHTINRYNTENKIASCTYTNGVNRREESFEYNKLGWMVKKITQDLYEKKVYSYLYNDKGQLIEEQLQTNSSKQPDYPRTLFAYDEKGRVNNIIYPSVHDTAYRNLHIEYHPNGQKALEKLVDKGVENVVYYVQYNDVGDEVAYVRTKGSSRRILIEYDDQSNWVRKLVVVDGVAVKLLERKIYYY